MSDTSAPPKGEPAADDGAEPAAPQAPQGISEPDLATRQIEQARERRKQARERQRQAAELAERIEQTWPRWVGPIAASFLRLSDKDRWSVAIQASVILITFIYAVFAGAQWWVTSEELNASQRAWVLPVRVLGVLTEDDLIAPKIIGLPVIVGNVGRSPALNVRVQVRPVLTDNFKQNFCDDTPRLLGEEIFDSVGLIGPGSEQPIPFNKTPIDAKYLELMSARPTLTYCIVGCFRYDDAVGQDRWTSFCYQFVPYISEPKQRFMQCAGGNLTDASE